MTAGELESGLGDLVELHRRAVDEFGARVRLVGDDQWHGPTPCTEWDVHALVNHMVYENLWTPPLLDAKTMEEVGSRFDGDLLGDDPVGNWSDAARRAQEAVARPGALGRTVHASFGDITGQEYVHQLTTDHVIHAWDLARAIGADERLEPDLLAFVDEYLRSSVEQWRAAGVFGPEVDVGPGADPQTALLALAGRRA